MQALHLPCELPQILACNAVFVVCSTASNNVRDIMLMGLQQVHAETVSTKSLLSIINLWVSNHHLTTAA